MRLLLPTLAARPFTNHFVVTKDAIGSPGSPWSSGGANTFDGTQGITVSAEGQTTLAAEGTYNGPDGVLTPNYLMAGTTIGQQYSGWITAGIFACEIDIGTAVVDLTFGCNFGYDTATQTGVVAKPFTRNGHAYELKTFWAGAGPKDSLPAGETQFHLTFVPYEAALNGPGANPARITGNGDTRQFSFPALTRGATVYIQWGRTTADAVQDWIIADLVESEEFASAPHPRLLPLPTRPLPIALTRCSANPPPRSVLTRFLPIGWGRFFYYDQGHGVIQGKVTIEGIAAVRRVRLFEAQTGRLVREVWSQPDGRYGFDHLDPTRAYFVVAHDHRYAFNAVIADRITAEIVSP